MAVRSDVVVDWASSPRIITVLAPSADLTVQDIVDTCRALEDDLINMNYAHLVEAAGKEDLGGGIFVGITVTLQNAKVAFEARPGPTYVQCNISGGNLVAVDSAGASMNPVQTTAFTQVVRTASSSATLQELSSIEHSSFGGGVTIDTVTGVAGTTFPTGTAQQPVNNLSDAQTIATERGFGSLYFKQNFTFGAGDNINNYNIYGQSHTKSVFTIDSAATASGVEIYDATLTGTLDGDTTVSNCYLKNVLYIKGQVTQCVLEGTTTLSQVAGGEAYFLNCWSGLPDQLAAPTIDLAGGGTNLNIKEHSGNITIKSGVTMTATPTIRIDLVSGNITLDSSVTQANIIVRGVGTLTDNSVGTSIDASALINNDSVWEAAKALSVPKFIALN